MNNSDKKKLLVFIPTIKKSKSKIKDIDIAIIGKNAYNITCYLKRAQLFVVSKRDI